MWRHVGSLDIPLAQRLQSLSQRDTAKKLFGEEDVIICWRGGTFQVWAGGNSWETWREGLKVAPAHTRTGNPNKCVPGTWPCQMGAHVQCSPEWVHCEHRTD